MARRTKHMALVREFLQRHCPTCGGKILPGQRTVIYQNARHHRACIVYDPLGRR